jgi:uncharacterized membrane protein YccC
VSTRVRLTILLSVLALGCQASPAATRIDLRAYLARTKTWAPVEAEAAHTIERILRTQFVDEAEVRRQIADNRPRVVAHLQALRAYRPQSPEVVRIHDRYVKAWEQLLAGYDAIEEGFTSGDYTKLARGREAMDAWRATIVSVADDLRELMQHFGVEPAGAVESRARGSLPQLATQSTKSSARPSAIA